MHCGNVGSLTEAGQMNYFSDKKLVFVVRLKKGLFIYLNSFHIGTNESQSGMLIKNGNLVKLPTWPHLLKVQVAADMFDSVK